VSVRGTADQPVTAALRRDRTRHPAEGLLGGCPGATGTVLVNGDLYRPDVLRERLNDVAFDAVWGVDGGSRVKG